MLVISDSRVPAGPNGGPQKRPTRCRPLRALVVISRRDPGALLVHEQFVEWVHGPFVNVRPLIDVRRRGAAGNLGTEAP
jgi:hypothetical protein